MSAMVRIFSRGERLSVPYSIKYIQCDINSIFQNYPHRYENMKLMITDKQYKYRFSSKHLAYRSAYTSGMPQSLKNEDFQSMMSEYR